MAKPILEYCEVNGTDVSAYVQTWKVIRAMDNKISKASIRFNHKVLDVINFDLSNAFHTIEIYRGVSAGNEKRIFKGEIYDFSLTGANITGLCRSEYYKSVRAEITKSFDKDIDTEAGKISALVITLMEDYACFTGDSSSVQDSGTVHILTKFICNHADVFERCQKLSEALDWQSYYNPEDDKIYLEPRGYSTYATILEVGVNVINSPMWDIKKDSMINYYAIIGGEDIVETEETFDGDAAEDTFTLGNTPVSVRMEVGGTLQTGGNEATTGSFDYQVDIENKQVKFEAGSVPGIGVGNVKAIYTHTLSRPVVQFDQESIDAYGEFKKTDFVIELVNVNDLTEYSNQIIATYKDPFISSKLIVIDAEDLFPGLQARCKDSVNNIDSFLYITRVEMNYPYRGDVVNVGDEDIRIKNFGTTTTDRIRRLEEEIGKNPKKLTHVFLSKRSIPFKRRYLELRKRSVETASDVFILGHADYGILGTNKLGDSGFGSYSTEKVIQGNDNYVELFYDTDFKDAALTTANWDTTNKKVVF